MSWTEFFWHVWATTHSPLTLAEFLLLCTAVLTWISSLRIEASTRGTKKAAIDAGTAAAARFDKEVRRQDWIALHTMLGEFVHHRFLHSFALCRDHEGEVNIMLRCVSSISEQCQRMAEDPLVQELLKFIEDTLSKNQNKLWEMSPSELDAFLALKDRIAAPCDPTYPANVGTK